MQRTRRSPSPPPWYEVHPFRAGDYYDLSHRGDRQMLFQPTELDPHDVASGCATPAQVDAAIADALRRFNPDRYCVSRIYAAMQFEYPKNIVTTFRSRVRSTVYDELLSPPQEQGIQWPPNPLHVHWPFASTPCEDLHP